MKQDLFNDRGPVNKASVNIVGASLRQDSPGIGQDHVAIPDLLNRVRDNDLICEHDSIPDKVVNPCKDVLLGLRNNEEASISRRQTQGAASERTSASPMSIPRRLISYLR